MVKVTTPTPVGIIFISLALRRISFITAHSRSPKTASTSRKSSSAITSEINKISRSYAATNEVLCSKHLDSHLKPYRCKALACVSVPFSSTACLLRHEREAHGMHGHGDKPYMCTYPDCDRSIQGNGFPRRWNLQDHMKRVHDYSVPSANGRASPTLSETANVKLSRSRRASGNSHASLGRKVTKANAKSTVPSKQKQFLKKQLLEYSDALQQGGDLLDASDKASHENLKALLQNMRRLASND